MQAFIDKLGMWLLLRVGALLLTVLLMLSFHLRPDPTILVPAAIFGSIFSELRRRRSNRSKQ
jgi:hypothetical protein